MWENLTHIVDALVSTMRENLTCIVDALTMRVRFFRIVEGIHEPGSGNSLMVILLVSFRLPYGNGLSQDGARPSFFPDSKSSKIELSIDVQFIFKLFWKGAKNFKKHQKGGKYIWRPCISNKDGLMKSPYAPPIQATKYLN